MEIPFAGQTTRVRAIAEVLHETYGSPRLGNPLDPVADLVYVCLSRMTQERKYRATFALIRKKLQTWDEVADAPLETLENLIAYAGLARTKARHIQAMLQEIRTREGSIDLSRLDHMNDTDVERYLCSLPGVSRKTALCVMMYALHREVLPVDTHVWRVSTRLGLAPHKPWSERFGKELERTVPPALRFGMHVNLIAHGRAVCRARNPRCTSCVLSQLCDRPGHA